MNPDDSAAARLAKFTGGDEPINILIVDDEPANLVVLETVLDDPRYRLVRALSADQALLALVEIEFALLILDVRLPGMTGFELAQIIKERKKTAGVPIIFLTAYFDKDQHVLEGYGSGAVDFLNKPVNPPVLRSKVSVFADLHRKNRAISLANNALMDEILERRRAEEQLRELNETLERRVLERTEALNKADQKLQAMMSSITDGLLMLDANWCFTYINEQGARLLGMSPAQLLGGCVWQLFPHAHATQFYTGFHQAAKNHQTLSFEEFYPEPLNLWLQCHCYPSEEGLSVYFHNISDRRDVELRREQLLAAEQAARTEGERVARAKDEFLASLSHELRTPLAAIIGWTQVLQQPDIDVQTVQRGIDAIARSGKAQANLVADLLDMSRIVSGKLRMNAERLDINAIALAAAEIARPLAHSKGVQIFVRDASSAIEIVGDETRLQQILSNLINNAIKFTPAGGSLTITLVKKAEYVEIAVADTGQGISAEFLPHLFDRFSQADGTAARVHGGLGLGLSIVKNLVELHAGTVTAASAGPGQGATFTLRFPFASAEVAQRLAALAAIASDNNLANSGPLGGVAPLEDELYGVSVLLVDDHADVLEVERRMLCDCGATVATALSAEQALKYLQSTTFDVLLCDLGMAGMNGFDLIKNIRSVLGKSKCELPAAAVTAFVRPQDLQRALDEGFQICIQKPVSVTTLAQTVSELMQIRGAPRGGGKSLAKAMTNEMTNEIAKQSGAAPEISVPTPRQENLAESPAKSSDSRLRALFVEDNLELQEQIEWLLAEEGLDVVACVSAEAAMQALGQDEFDVIITDVSLPKMSGVEFARWALAKAPNRWLIFSTGYPMGDKLEQFGPNVRALLKPFEAEELHQLMAEIRSDPNRKRGALTVA